MKTNLIIFLLLISCFVNAQDVLNIDVNEVVVSSNRAQDQENITNIQIISLEEIESSPVQSIEDLLEYAINVDIRQRGRQGVQSDISMRGGSFEQVLIMLNGIKLNDPQTGHHNLNLPITLEQIEKIEVITGGASRIYGNYAYTGAINIITKKICQNSVDISSGNNKFKNGSLNLGYSKKNYNHNLSINQKTSDGYIMGMDYNIKNYYYQINSTKNGVYKLINAGYSEKEFGAFSFYTPVYPNQFEKTKTTFASFQIKTEGSISFRNNSYWRKHNDNFILFRDNPSLYQNFHETNVFGTDMNIVQKTKHGSNVFGMEIRNDNIISNVLGENLQNPIQIDSNNFYFKGANRTMINLFVEKNIKLDNLNISTGFMTNINSDYGNSYFPGIDLSYRIKNNISFFISYNKSMRAPNYTELYYKSPTNEGNVNLQPEHSENKEIGFKYKQNNIQTNVTFYERNGENMIDWILLDGDSIWKTQNLSRINTVGYEINSIIDINNLLNLNLPISPININYAVNKSDTTSNGFQSAYVLDHLKTNLSISTKQILNNNLFANWRFTYQDREGGYIDFANGTENEYLPFWIIDIKLSYNTLYNTTVYLELNNLLDKKYVDFGNIPQPGRWLRAGIKINL
tara:strand:- start:106 stop:1989 length:1884 start_codon:yes stop_codon:yes gene_type:complete